MAQLIVKSSYMKTNRNKSHVTNMVEYIATREGVEKNQEPKNEKQTEKQEEFIRDTIREYPDLKNSLEYEDWVNNPTKSNASDFIGYAAEQICYMDGRLNNYVEYIAKRPRVEKSGEHGLFGQTDEAIALSQKMKEISEHQGNVYTNIISLRRADAERLGYNNQESWKQLLRSCLPDIAKAYKTPMEDLKWYAAFHNESHHPHIHMIVYSTNERDAYLTQKGLQGIKSTLMNEIFKYDRQCIFSKMTDNRDQIKKITREYLQRLFEDIEGQEPDGVLMALMQQLSAELPEHGKLQYGYMPSDVKNLVDAMVDQLESIPSVKQAYDIWYDLKCEHWQMYGRTNKPPKYRLSQEPEFRPIKNIILQSAKKLKEAGVPNWDAEEAQEPTNDSDSMQTSVPNWDTSLNSEDMYEENLQRVFRNMDIESEDNESNVVEEEVISEDEPNPENPEIETDRDTFEFAKVEESFSGASQEGNCAYGKNGEYVQFTKEFKEGRRLLYGLEKDKKSKGFEMLLNQSLGGNLLATAEIAHAYEFGIGVEEDETQPKELYSKVFVGLQNVLGNNPDEFWCGYLNCKLGKMQAAGNGCEPDEELSFSFIERGARYDKKYATYLLACLYLNGTGVEQNEEKALQLFRVSADNGNPYAMYRLAKKGQESYYKDALQGFLCINEKTPLDSLQYRIGYMYLHGEGCDIDEETAVSYLTAAEENGNVDAKYELALTMLQKDSNYYEPAHGVTVLEELLEDDRVSDLTTKRVSYKLGQIYMKGELVERDLVHAKTLFELSDTNFADYHLAKINAEMGNKDEAARRLKKAAEELPYAKVLLGKWYEEGYIITRDIAMASRIYGEAAEMGDTSAMYRLGIMMHAEGLTEEAVQMMEQAISGSVPNPYAAIRLGLWYWYGDGVECDRERAEELFQVARDSGIDYEAPKSTVQTHDEEGRNANDAWYGILKGLSRLFESQINNLKNKTSAQDRKAQKEENERKEALGYRH